MKTSAKTGGAGSRNGAQKRSGPSPPPSVGRRRRSAPQGVRPRAARRNCANDRRRRARPCRPLVDEPASPQVSLLRQSEMFGGKKAVRWRDRVILGAEELSSRADFTDRLKCRFRLVDAQWPQKLGDHRQKGRRQSPFSQTRLATPLLPAPPCIRKSDAVHDRDSKREHALVACLSIERIAGVSARTHQMVRRD
jgi:hypothetical protein